MFKKKETSLLSKIVLAGLLIGIICLVFTSIHQIFAFVGSIAFIVTGIALIAMVISKIFFNK
ncbi:MAG: hypothetical protein IJM95_03870 [Anaerotignum sp.]|nr:hypothetical protein [Anaerotignum sp.]